MTELEFNLWVLRVLLLMNIVAVPINWWLVTKYTKLKDETLKLSGMTEATFNKSLILQDKAMKLAGLQEMYAKREAQQ